MEKVHNAQKVGRSRWTVENVEQAKKLLLLEEFVGMLN